jgi:hypothetical protein
LDASKTLGGLLVAAQAKWTAGGYRKTKASASLGDV